MEAVVTIDRTRREDFPKLVKCCFFFNLRHGLNVWLSLESLLWSFLFICAFYYEIFFIQEVELIDFADESDEWYFYLVFGDRLHYMDQKIRSEWWRRKFFATVNMR